jgi:hypothetical protein
VNKFFSALITIVEQMDILYQEEGMKKQMLDKKSMEYNQYKCATHCHICEEEITNTMSLKEFLTRGRPEEDVEDDYVREGDTKTAQSKEEELQLKGPKVYDHCHWTGEYRGPAHSTCNLQLSASKSIPVFFHNLSNYDAHFIMQELHNIPEIEDIEVTAKLWKSLLTLKLKFLSLI